MDLIEDEEVQFTKVPEPEDKYYTLKIPINEILRLKFKAETGHELKEDYIELEVEYDDSNYKLFSLNKKLIIYNDIISLTNQKVTEHSLKPFGYNLKTKYD